MTLGKFWSHNFNGIVFLDKVTVKAVMMPEAGVFKDSIIRIGFSDGSTSTVKWEGEVTVKAGDVVRLDRFARIIIVPNPYPVQEGVKKE